VENVWDDGVAPETAIDFDAPHISTIQALASLGAAFTFIYGLYLFVSWRDPVALNPALPRSAILNDRDIKYDLGMISKEEYDALGEEHGDEEHEEEHEEEEE
jgi:hypothetical protein